MGKPVSMKSLVNEKFNKLNFNDNESMKREKNTKVIQTEYIANKLQQEYHAPGSYAFFLKCAWHLSEGEIWNVVELSRKPWIKMPVKYFVKSCSNLMAEKSA